MIHNNKIHFEGFIKNLIIIISKLKTKLKELKINKINIQYY